MSMKSFCIHVWLIVCLLSVGIPGSPGFAAKNWYDAYQEGIRALKNEDWKTARTLLEKAIAEEPEPHRKKMYGNRAIEYYPYLYLGMACLKAGEMEAAYQYCEQAKNKGVEPQKEIEQCLRIASRFLERRPTPLPLTPTPLLPTPTPGDTNLSIKFSSTIPAETDQDSLDIQGIVSGGNGIKEIRIRRDNLGVIQTQTLSFPNPRGQETFRVNRVLDVGQNDFTIEAVDMKGQVGRQVFTVVRKTIGPIDKFSTPTPVPMLLPTPTPPVPTPIPPLLTPIPPSNTRPSITLISEIPAETEKTTLTIEGIATDDQGITEVLVSIQGRKGLKIENAPVPERLKNPRKQFNFKKDIPLEVGTNEILIVAKNISGQEQQETVSIVRTGVPTPTPIQTVITSLAGQNVYAVIIGIGKYQDQRLELRFTVNDAQGLYDILTDPNYGGIPKDNIQLLLDDKATVRNIKGAIGKWLSQQAKEDDTVIIYYSGHGAPEGRETYWVTYDADINDLYSTALSNNEIADMLSRIQSKRVVTFLDSCYSAATVIRKDQTRAAPTEIPLENFAGEGRVVISASNGKQQSLELDAYRHGVFTYYLLDGLKGKADGKAGEAPDGVIDVDEIWNYVKNQVQDASRKAGNLQTPVLQGAMSAGIPLTVNKAFLDDQQRLKNLKQQQDQLTALFEQGHIQPEHFDCALKMLDSGKTNKYLEGLLSGKLSPEVFGRFFKCETQK